MREKTWDLEVRNLTMLKSKSPEKKEIHGEMIFLKKKKISLDKDKFLD